MADWPTLDEVKTKLDITGDDTDDDLDATRLAAIGSVKGDVGSWDEMTDTPDEALSRAALRLAELLWMRGEPSLTDRLLDRAYYGYLFGHRKAFPIS